MWFQSARRDARFCSDACRQWSYRERRLLRMGWGVVKSLGYYRRGPVVLLHTHGGWLGSRPVPPSLPNWLSEKDTTSPLEAKDLHLV